MVRAPLIGVSLCTNPILSWFQFKDNVHLYRHGHGSTHRQAFQGAPAVNRLGLFPNGEVVMLEAFIEKLEKQLRPNWLELLLSFFAIILYCKLDSFTSAPTL